MPLRISSSDRRIMMFMLGGFIALIFFQGAEESLALQRHSSVSTPVFVAWGMIALFVHETMQLNKHKLRSEIGVVSIIVVVLAILLFVMLPAVAAGHLARPVLDTYGQDPRAWGSFLIQSIKNRHTLLTAALIVSAEYVLLRRPGILTQVSKAKESQARRQWTATDWSDSEPTRLLCASALYLGSEFRRSVIYQIRDKHRAIAPEVGVDMSLLVRVCVRLEKRETIYQFLLIAVWVIAVLLGVEVMLRQTLPSELALMVALLALSTWTIQYYKLYDEQYHLLQLFRRDRYDPRKVAEMFDVDLPAKIASGIATPQQNVVVYSMRKFLPFRDAGYLLFGEPIAVDITRPKRQFGHSSANAPSDFAISDLYAAIDSAILKLGISNLSIKDWLFVRGIDIRHDCNILPRPYSRPRQDLDPQIVEQYMNNRTNYIRYYKWIQKHYWKSNAVLSTFLRCSFEGKNLFVEMNYSFLSPLTVDHAEIEKLLPRDTVGMIILAWRASVQSVRALVDIWREVYIKASDAIKEFVRIRDIKEWWEVHENPLFDYGSAPSVRKSRESRRWQHYFQKADSDLYLKTINRTVFDTLVEFLDQHGIDISDLKKMRTTLINNGIINNGVNNGTMAGSIQAQAFAGGAHGQAKVERNDTQPVKENEED